MDGHFLFPWVTRLAGVGLILLTMADVFMTVLYARVGTGPISHRLASGSRGVVRRVSRCLSAEKKIRFCRSWGRRTSCC